MNQVKAMLRYEKKAEIRRISQLLNRVSEIREIVGNCGANHFTEEINKFSVKIGCELLDYLGELHLGKDSH